MNIRHISSCLIVVVGLLASAATYAATTSPSGTIVTPGKGSITDASGNVYMITSSGAIEKNSAALPGGGGTGAIEYSNGAVYFQDGTTHTWYTWNGSNFIASAAPPSSTPPSTTPSPSGTTVTPGKGTITDASGNIYLITAAGAIQENGQALAGGGGTGAIEYANKVVYFQDATTHKWYTWNGSNFITSAAPPSSTPAPTPGACGSENGLSGSVKPTANLCTSGTPSAVSGTGPWTWSCAGANGGLSAACSEKLIINGVCGAANGTTDTTTPTANLCSSGTPSAVSGTGPWSWSCAGSNDGATADCSAQLPAAPSVFLTQQQLNTPLTAQDARYLLTRVGFVPTDAEIEAITGVALGKAVTNIINSADTLAFVQPLPAWTPWSPTTANPSDPATATLQSDFVSFNANYISGAACRTLNLQSLTNNCTSFTTLDATDKAAYVNQYNLNNSTERASFRNWWAGQMILSQTPLAERMVLFWHNLFPAIDFNEWPFFNQDMEIRTQALKNYKTLVSLMLHDANLLVFLNQPQSTVAAPTANLAREFMELFTLGVDGGYTQNDVDAVSFAFTGLSQADYVGVYYSDAKHHESSTKTILGKTCASPCSPDDVVDIVFDPNPSVSPGPGPYIVSKLWSEFVSNDPDNHTNEINTIATNFKSNSWDIPSLLTQLFETQAFWSVENKYTLIKSPAEFITGIVRSDLDRATSLFVSNAPTAKAMATSYSMTSATNDAIVSAIAGSGENFWNPPNVKGFLTGINWINTSTLVNRQSQERAMLTTNYEPHILEPAGIDVSKISMTPAQYVVLTNTLIPMPPMLLPPAKNATFINGISQAFGDPAYWLK